MTGRFSTGEGCVGRTTGHLDAGGVIYHLAAVG